MKLEKRNTKLGLVAVLGILLASQCAHAKIEGAVSQEHFFDSKKTLTPEIKVQKEAKIQEYWSENALQINKYKPFFMLSNKELYNFKPEPKKTYSYKVPSVYNVSFKSSKVKTVSFDKTDQIKTLRELKDIDKAKEANKAPKDAKSTTNLQALKMYEKMKSTNVDADEKINVAITLKETKRYPNYQLALNLLDEVTEKEPYNAYAFFIKGEVYSAKKDIEHAVINYVEALRINPYSKKSYLGLARVIEPTNKALAQKYYEKAKETKSL